MQLWLPFLGETSLPFLASPYWSVWHSAQPRQVSPSSVRKLLVAFFGRNSDPLKVCLPSLWLGWFFPSCVPYFVHIEAAGSLCSPEPFRPWWTASLWWPYSCHDVCHWPCFVPSSHHWDAQNYGLQLCSILSLSSQQLQPDEKWACPFED